MFFFTAASTAEGPETKGLSLTKKTAQLAHELLRPLLGNEVAAGERAAAHVGRDLAPVFQAVEERLDHALLSPEREQRHADLPRQVLLVVHQVDGGGGAVVLAGRVDGARVLERAHVLGHGLFGEVLEAAFSAAEAFEDVKRRLALEHALRNRCFLDQEE